MDSNAPNGKHIKKKWSEEEDQQLIEAVNKIGESHWTAISKYVKGRNGKQCRERWIGMLDPNLSREEWSSFEDALLIEKQKEIGNKWSKICLFFPNRSSITLKNRWNWLDKHNSLTTHNEQLRSNVKYKTNTENDIKVYFSGDSWKELGVLDCSIQSLLDFPISYEW